MSGNIEKARAGSGVENAFRLSLGSIARQVPAAELQIIVAIIVLASTFSFAFPDSFATAGTLINMARVAGILLVVAIGQSFALIVGGFDISVGATMGFVSIVASLWMVNGGGVESAILLGIVAGTLVGVINGFVIAALGVTPFIATLGMFTFLRGLLISLATVGQSRAYHQR